MTAAVWLIVLLAAGCGSGTIDGDGSAEDPSSDAPDPEEDVWLDSTPDGSDPDGSADSCDLIEEVDSADAPAEPPAPAFSNVMSYETVIAGSGDPATVYYPAPADLAPGAYSFPYALLLQGAEVARQHYSIYSTAVASYGFIVVVPDHESIGAMGPGLYAQQSQIDETIAHMTAESLRSGSPVRGVVDTSKLVLLGHSYGGVCGMSAIREVCQPPFCFGSYTRPPQLVGGAFWGTNLAMPLVGTIPQTENDCIPIALVQGTLDSMALPADALETWEKIQDPPKAIVQVGGANHYGICDVLAPPGADPDGSAPALPLESSREVAARWSALFLRAHVLSDAEALEWVHGGGGDLDPFVTVLAIP